MPTKVTYRDYIRSLPCYVTGYIGDQVDPHHIKGYAHVTGCAGALKSSDLCCIPLHHDLHNELHNNGWETFERKHNMSQLEAMVKTILRAERDGMIEINFNEVKNYVR